MDTYDRYLHLRSRAIHWGPLVLIRRRPSMYSKPIEEIRQKAAKVIDRALLGKTPEQRAERLRKAGVTEEHVISGLAHFRS